MKQVLSTAHHEKPSRMSRDGYEMKASMRCPITQVSPMKKGNEIRKNFSGKMLILSSRRLLLAWGLTNPMSVSSSIMTCPRRLSIITRKQDVRDEMDYQANACFFTATAISSYTNGLSMK